MAPVRVGIDTLEHRTDCYITTYTSTLVYFSIYWPSYLPELFKVEVSCRLHSDVLIWCYQRINNKQSDMIILAYTYCKWQNISEKLSFNPTWGVSEGGTFNNPLPSPWKWPFWGPISLNWVPICHFTFIWGRGFLLIPSSRCSFLLSN